MRRLVKWRPGLRAEVLFTPVDVQEIVERRELFRKLCKRIPLEALGQLPDRQARGEGRYRRDVGRDAREYCEVMHLLGRAVCGKPPSLLRRFKVIHLFRGIAYRAVETLVARFPWTRNEAIAGLSPR